MLQNISDFRYLYPPLEAFDIKHTDEYIKHGKQKKIVRKIFHFVNYDEYENEKIKELSTAINHEKITLPTNWLESDTLKYCFAGKFKIPNCIKQLKKHLEWRNNTKVQNLSDDALELLKRGLIYFYGRDKNYRPVIVFDVHKINFKKDKVESIINAFSFLLTTVYQHSFIPGKIENWIIIIDINNMSLMHVPFKVLHQVIDCMSNNYVSTVERLYITNPSSSLFVMWKIIEAMMDPETVQKIRFIKKNNFSEIQDYVHPTQLQKKYGGQLDDLIIFWPPKTLINVEKDIPTIESNLLSLRERIKFGCQLTNCLPEKKIVLQEIKKVGDEENKNKEGNAIMGKKNLIIEERFNEIKEESLIEERSNEIKEESLQNSNNNGYNSNKNSHKDSHISAKNENFEKELIENNPYKKILHNDIPKSAEILYQNDPKENDEQNYDEGTNLEVLEHRSKSMDQQLIFEREEKNLKCQYCKECIIY